LEIGWHSWMDIIFNIKILEKINIFNVTCFFSDLQLSVF